MLKETRFVYLIMLVTLILYLLWSLIIPFGEAPDEPLRYDIANFIYKYHELPLAMDTRLTNFGHGITYAALPQLPYIFGGILMIISKGIINEENLFYVHRLISVISGVVAVYFVFKICQELKLSKGLIYFVTCIFAFVPQYAFINSYVNQESFSICVNLFIVYTWFKGSKENWPYSSIVKLAIGISLSLLTYLNGYVTIPASALLLLLTLKGNKYLITKKILVLSLIVFCLAGWWFIRNFVNYNGDFLGLNTMRSVAEVWSSPEQKPSIKLTLAMKGFTIPEMFTKTDWWESSYNSFWAVFGGMNVTVDSKYYHYIGMLHLISFFGIIFVLYDKFNLLFKRKIQLNVLIKKDIMYILLCLIIVMTFALTTYYSFYSDYQPQGRYLFPALFPVILFIGIGFEKILKDNIRNVIYCLTIISMFFLNVNSLLNIILFKYYS
jgi:hypothetical protein